MSIQMSCGGSDRLCLESSRFRFDQSLTVFWPSGQIPAPIQQSSLELRLYHGDLLAFPQNDPCVINRPLLRSWRQQNLTNSPYSDMSAASVTIPSDSAILKASESLNQFFFQIRIPNQDVCMYGPYSIPRQFTSFGLSKSLASPSTVSSTTSTPTAASSSTTTDPLPPSNNNTSSSSFNYTGLWIGLGVTGFALLLIGLIIFLIRQYRSKSNGYLGDGPTESVRGLKAGDDASFVSSQNSFQESLSRPSRNSMSQLRTSTDEIIVPFPATQVAYAEPPTNASQVYLFTPKEAQDISDAFKTELFNKENMDWDKASI